LKSFTPGKHKTGFFFEDLHTEHSKKFKIWREKTRRAMKKVKAINKISQINRFTFSKRKTSGQFVLAS
jgi:serine/threonine protein kinase